jgi:hypothetical protein
MNLADITGIGGFERGSMGKLIKKQFKLFLLGMGSTFDLFGSLPTRHPPRMRPRRPNEAIRDHWRAVGRDLNTGIRRFEKELSISNE